MFLERVQKSVSEIDLVDILPIKKVNRFTLADRSSKHANHS